MNDNEGNQLPWITEEQIKNFTNKVRDMKLRTDEEGHGMFLARRYASQHLLQLTTEVVKLLNTHIPQDSFTGPVPADVFTNKSIIHGYDCNRIAKELLEVFQTIGLKSARLSYCQEMQHLSVSIGFKSVGKNSDEYGFVHIDAGCHMLPFIIFDKEERQIENGLGRKFHIKLNFGCANTYIEYTDHNGKITRSILLPESKGNDILKSLQNPIKDWSIIGGEANSLYFKSETGEVKQSVQVEITQNKRKQDKKNRQKADDKPKDLYFNIKVTATFYQADGDFEKVSLPDDGYIEVTYEEIKNKIGHVLQLLEQNALDKLENEDEKEFIRMYTCRENKELSDFLLVKDFFACLLHYCKKYDETWKFPNINQPRKRDRKRGL